MDKPGGLTGSDASGALSWILPLAVGAMGFANPRGAQSLAGVAQILAQQQMQKHQETQTANLEQERALDREFRTRQETRQGRLEARDIAKEQAGIQAGQMFPSFAGGVTETVPAVPGQPQKDMEFPDVGEFISEPTVPGAPEVSRQRAPTFSEIFGRIQSAKGLDPRVAAALSERASTYAGATRQPERPQELQRVEAARAMEPFLVSRGIHPLVARQAAAVAEATGQMPSAELLRDPSLQFVNTSEMIYGLNARTGEIVSSQPIRSFERPIVNVVADAAGNVTIIAVDPRNPTQPQVSKKIANIGAGRAPSTLSTNEVVAATLLLEQGAMPTDPRIPLEFRALIQGMDQQQAATFARTFVEEAKQTDPIKRLIGEMIDLKGGGPGGKRPTGGGAVAPPPPQASAPRDPRVDALMQQSGYTFDPQTGIYRKAR